MLSYQNEFFFVKPLNVNHIYFYSIKKQQKKKHIEMNEEKKIRLNIEIPMWCV